MPEKRSDDHIYLPWHMIFLRPQEKRKLPRESIPLKEFCIMSLRVKESRPQDACEIIWIRPMRIWKMTCCNVNFRTAKLELNIDYWRMNISGKIFDIKKYAIHDGPGIRTTVFLKGCPLTCGWCHNPEGLWSAPKIIYEFNRCIGCGDCIEACREAAISATPSGMSTDRHRCKGCGLCVDACPGGARDLTERTVTVDRLVEII